MIYALHDAFIIKADFVLQCIMVSSRSSSLIDSGGRFPVSSCDDGFEMPQTCKMLLSLNDVFAMLFYLGCWSFLRFIVNTCRIEFALIISDWCMLYTERAEISIKFKAVYKWYVALQS